MPGRTDPLCPAGHLPHEGGDRPSPPPSRTATVAGASGAPKLPISPLEGEMSGRTEGGA
ncbi:MAG: lytic murein transglycosylase [Mesorhizobium sp.]|nr:MAG: lytic murein transglycosylase [Mesorhizobium sp.]RWO58642.1 MAG: lytic murein transglycosylase [Mesorhizobium sp.]